MMKETIDTPRHVQVMRYITPLREGGSLPAIVAADDDFNYVLKFRGAGQGVKALIAELIGGELARLLGFKVPELVFAHLDVDFGRTEGDEEIQDLLKWSTGLNLGLHYLSGAINFDPLVMNVDAATASGIVWLDGFLTNIDRTYRNTNMLMWHKELWLIDHGASLYFHHSPSGYPDKARSGFPMIKDHVLLRSAAQLSETNEKMKSIIKPTHLAQLTALIPDDWLQWRENDQSPAEIRAMYTDFLQIRLENADIFTKEAENARAVLI
jgi:hypothetical protein